MEKKKATDLADLIQDETLDMNPEQIHHLGHYCTDLIVDYYKNISNTPVVPDITLKQMKRLVDEPLPYDEMDPQVVLNEFQKKIIGNTVKIGNPRLLGWMLPSGTVIGAFADGLASALNQNVAVSGSGIATAVELLVVDWIKEIIGYDSNAAGVLVSGGSIANLTALAVARNVKSDFYIRTHGVQQKGDIIFYASEEAHMCISKAADMLGIGTNNIRWVNVDQNFCLDIDDLKAKIIEDRHHDKRPFAVVATAGTVNTGAIDPLDSIADICQKYNLWFHVDAAYGGFATLSPNLKPLLKGMSRADSIAINPHKWLFIPYEAGCILVKNPLHMREAFAVNTDYVHVNATKIPTTGDVDFSDYGLQLSRSFRALKIWMSLKQHGVKKYGRIITQNINLAHYLAAVVQESADFRIVTTGNLSIVCFQYFPKDLQQQYQKSNLHQRKKMDTYLNQLNLAIVESIRTDGQILLSSTILGEMFVLRACIINYRTTKKDIKDIVEIVQNLGTTVDARLRKSFL